MMCDLISWLLKQVDNTRGWTLERETARKAEGERERYSAGVEVHCVSILSQLSSWRFKGQSHSAFSHSHLAILTELSKATLTESAISQHCRSSYMANGAARPAGNTNQWIY